MPPKVIWLIYSLATSWVVTCQQQLAKMQSLSFWWCLVRMESSLQVQLELRRSQDVLVEEKPSAWLHARMRYASFLIEHARKGIEREDRADPNWRCREFEHDRDDSHQNWPEPDPEPNHPNLPIPGPQPGPVGGQGVWGPWITMSKCNTECGKEGSYRQARLCLTEPRLRCSGEQIQSLPCPKCAKPLPPIPPPIPYNDDPFGPNPFGDVGY
ncbi:unnamed protein product, partial [Mesorhabditis spiculigera]